MGQSHVRYLDEDSAAPFRSQLIRYIGNPEYASITTPRGGGSGKGSGKQSDPELRSKVETEAVKYVSEYYQSKGFSCRSVEKDNAGWDLELSNGCVELLVEVKGCSGSTPSVEVTPNEYRQMKAKRHHGYRLAIVTNALNNRYRRLSIVSYNKVNDSWHDEDGQLAYIKEFTAARIDLQTS